MKPWDVYTWSLPEAGAHPAVIVGTDERLRLKDRVNVLLCSNHRSQRPPEAHEVLLNGTDGLGGETLCTCDLLYAVDKSRLTHRLRPSRAGRAWTNWFEVSRPSFKQTRSSR